MYFINLFLGFRVHIIKKRTKYYDWSNIMKDIKGYVSFVLHAHLPFVHHPESEDYLEEQWLFEAMSETYIPLLLRLDIKLFVASI